MDSGYKNDPGRILLAPSYPVDANEAFNEMVFFEMLK